MYNFKLTNKMSESKFSLKKVKLLPAGGLEVEYSKIEVRDTTSAVTDYKAKFEDAEVHPDLLNAFRELAPLVAKAIGLTAFLSAVNDAELPEGLREKFTDLAEEQRQRIDVRGISLSGDNEDEGVVITSVLETKNGLKTRINTPRIKFKQVSYGFEERLDYLVQSIREEVRAFIIDGKTANPSLFGGE